MVVFIVSGFRSVCEIVMLALQYVIRASYLFNSTLEDTYKDDQDQVTHDCKDLYPLAPGRILIIWWEHKTYTAPWD